MLQRLLLDRVFLQFHSAIPSVSVLQSVMAWNHDGSLLASASQKGTVIRVFRLPEVAKAYTFRRGTTTSTIHSLAFSPPSVKPALLCAASAHGTVHLFHLEEPVG